MLEFITRFLGGIQNQEFLTVELNTIICLCITLKTYILEKLKCL